MTGDDAKSAATFSMGEGLDLVRRRIRVRAWRRGMREMDLILGGFADAHIEALDAAELMAFEALLDAPDDEAFAWFCQGKPPPAYDTPLFDKIAAFHAAKGSIR